MSKTLMQVMGLAPAPDKPGRGGKRAGAGRPVKSKEKRVQKSVNLTPATWAIIATDQAKHGGSESDAIERLLSNQ